MGQLDHGRGKVPEAGAGSAVSATVTRTEPASCQPIGSVGRSAATLSWAIPSSAEGLRFPTLHLNPSLENPLENLFRMGVSAASGSGGAGRGRAAAAASTPPGASDSAGLGRAHSACSPLGPSPWTSGATRRQRMPRRRVCAGAGLCRLRSWGGRVLPASQDSGSFLELPVRRCEKPPGSPRLREATSPKEPQKPWETLAAPAPGLSVTTGKMTEIHKHPPKAATRFPLLSGGYLFCPLRGWHVWRETRALASPLGCGPRPPVTCHQVWGGAEDHRRGDGQQGGGGDRLWGAGRGGEHPGSPPGEPREPLLENLPWGLP